MTSPNLQAAPQAGNDDASMESRVLIGDGDVIMPSQGASSAISMPDPDVQSPDQLWDRRLDRW